MFGPTCKWEQVFDLEGEAGIDAIAQMVKHLQALPVEPDKVPDGLRVELDNLSWFDAIGEATVEKTQINYFQTGGGAVSASVEYFRPEEVTPFHAAGYTLSCAPSSNWGWWGAIAAAGVGAFILGQQ